MKIENYGNGDKKKKTNILFTDTYFKVFTKASCKC